MHSSVQDITTYVVSQVDLVSKVETTVSRPVKSAKDFILQNAEACSKPS